MLNKLPADVLALILALEISYTVVNLWKCGNRSLNATLANGGCTHIELLDYSASTSRWPQMLSALRKLRSLRLFCSRHVLQDSAVVSRALRALSPSLETLHLCCIEVESFFFIHEALPGDSSNLPHPNALQCGTSRLWDIAATFPRLTTLKLSQKSKSKNSYFHWCQDDLSVLPPTLTHLTIPTLDIISSDRLPSSVTELAQGSFPTPYWDPAQWDLPTNLVLLDGVHVRQSHLALLPRSMTTFKTNQLEWGPQLDAVLPTGTKHLTITNMRSDLPQLPSSLTSLHISYKPSLWLMGHPNYYCTPSHLKLLPTTLCKLYLDWNLDWNGIIQELESSPTSSTLWPPRLEDAAFTFPYADSVIAAIFKCLPRTLKRLSFLSGRTFSTRAPPGAARLDFTELPSSLTYLLFDVFPSNNSRIANGLLPPQLKYFGIASDSSHFSYLRLPQTLSSLKLASLIPPQGSFNSILPALPSRLTQLESISIALSAIASLPSTLTKLQIERLFDPQHIPKGVMQYGKLIAQMQHPIEANEFGQLFAHFFSLKTLTFQIGRAHV